MYQTEEVCENMITIIWSDNDKNYYYYHVDSICHLLLINDEHYCELLYNKYNYKLVYIAYIFIHVQYFIVYTCNVCYYVIYN